MEQISTFAERLKQLMVAEGLTNSDIAKVIGKHKSNVTRYLSGDYEAKQDVLFALANAYCVNEAWLMGLDYPMYKHDAEEVTLGDRMLAQSLNGITEEEKIKIAQIIKAYRE